MDSTTHTDLISTGLVSNEPDANPIVFAKDGEVFANSRDVAIYFGKIHRDVVRAINNLIKQESDLGMRNFAQTPYVEASNGQTYISYDMDRDGFTLLSMGFTGKKALKWKLKYIEAFNNMEAQLRQPMAIDYSDPKVALGFIEHLSSQVKEKEAVIEEQRGRLKKLDRLEGAKGSMCITDAAKTLAVKRDFLFKFMQTRRWIFKRSGNKNWLAYDAVRHAGYMEHDDHLYMDNEGRERVSTQALVTAKGLVKLAELIEQPLH
ncbi:phage regulatory protein/antirepressor Ant [Brucella pseudintermedia]|uniref:Rha family transcriptional regulator n=1 Tax=Brucella pseudintermedia TaxID=370111 RepID=UPI0032099B3B